MVLNYNFPHTIHNTFPSHGYWHYLRLKQSYKPACSTCRTTLQLRVMLVWEMSYAPYKSGRFFLRHLRSLLLILYTPYICLVSKPRYRHEWKILLPKFLTYVWLNIQLPNPFLRAECHPSSSLCPEIGVLMCWSRSGDIHGMYVPLCFSL